MMAPTRIATYETHDAAKVAIRALERAGIARAELSIVGHDLHTEEHAIGFFTSGDRMRLWLRHGALWGALGGVVFGGVVSSSFSTPFVDGLVGAIAGGALGFISGAFASLGIPDDRIVRYDSITTGTFSVLARGSAESTALARSVLGMMPAV